jgi:catechol 2,3-dioxygenase-like lactoylglutathione lyase family enzyme
MANPKTINVVRLSFVAYQHPDLQKAAQFLEDFGLRIVRKRDSTIYFAGYGIDPYCYVAEQSPEQKRKFLGGTWVVASYADLETAASHPTATSIEEVQGPGGGKKVSLTDPNGNPVSFVHGQSSRTPAVETEITRETEDTASPNFAYRKTRQGRFRRFELGPSPVHKIGHYGYMVPKAKYKETLDFYTSIMNLKPTDSVYNPETGEDTTCFMHVDLGKEYSDHHVKPLWGFEKTDAY